MLPVLAAWCIATCHYLLALAFDERRERVAAYADLTAVRIARAHEEHRRDLGRRAPQPVARRNALCRAHLARNHLRCALRACVT